MQRILYYIFIYNILFEGVLGMRQAPEVTKKTPAEVGHTGTRRGKSDSKPLAELAGTGQCGAGTDESRMTSGGIDDVNAEWQPAELPRKKEPDNPAKWTT